MSEINNDRIKTQRKSKTYEIVMTAIMTAVICILAPMSIPIGVVPISLTNFAVFLALYLLGWKNGTLSCIVYVLIGALGLPVFSGFSGGLGKLLGPTGGYIIGFIPMAVIAGLAIDKFGSRIIHFIALVTGTAVCYAFGTAWFCVVMDSEVVAALGTCVFPFIPFDIAKMIIIIIIGPALRKRLKKEMLLG